jgi:hypothetical protein
MKTKLILILLILFIALSFFTAKAAVGASHRCAMPCAKPDCQ